MLEIYKKVLTDFGSQCQAQALSGKKITFTVFQLGDGEYTGEETVETLMKMTALKSQKQEFGISKMELSEGSDTIILTLIAINSEVNIGYHIREIGIFAKDVNGTQGLYSICVAKKDKPDWMPAYNGIDPVALVYRDYLRVGNAENISVDLNSGGLATEKMLEETATELRNEIETLEFDDYTEEGAEVPGARDAISAMISGMKRPTMLSKIKAALMGLVTLGEMRALLVNNGLCTEPGKFFMDAAFGKTLQDQINEVNSDLGTKVSTANIVNNCTSTVTDKPLSAAQGKVLMDGKAPKSHASTATTYGCGTGSNYGHVKLSDSYSASGGAASAGVGASSKALVDAYNKLINDISTKVSTASIVNNCISTTTNMPLSAAQGKILMDEKAQKSHASTATTYGLGTGSNYGHVKLSDSYSASGGAASAGVGASSKALVDAYNKLNVEKAASNHMHYWTDITSLLVAKGSNASKSGIYSSTLHLIRVTYQGTVTIEADKEYLIMTIPYNAFYAAQSSCYILSDDQEGSIKVHVDGSSSNIYLFSSKPFTAVTVGFGLIIPVE